MLVYWVCKLVPTASRSTLFQPKLMEILNTQQSVGIRASWGTQLAGVHPAPVAVGAADLTPSQYALIANDNQIWTVDSSAWNDTFSTLSNPVKNRVNGLFDDAGVTRPVGTDTIRDALDRLLKAMQPGWSIEQVMVHAQSKP